MRQFQSRPSRGLLLILLLSSGGWLTACQDDVVKLQVHMTRGEEYAEAEQLKEAIIEFKNALQLDPNHSPAHYQLAHAYLRSQKAREGYWELRETVRLDPTNHEAKLEFAQLAIIAGEKEEALVKSTEVVEAQPDNFRAYLMQGQALASLDRPDEALQVYRKAVEVAPDEVAALTALSVVEAHSGNLEATEALHIRINELDPGYKSFSFHGRWLLSRGPEFADQAETAFKAALETATEGDRDLAYGQLASFYVRTDRFDQAVAVLEEGVEAEAETLSLIYLLARLQRGAGNKEQADKLIESTTLAKPDDPNVHLVLAAYRARNGDFEGGLAAAEMAIELDADLVDAKLEKAEILMELGHRNEREGALDESREIVDQVLASGKNRPRALVVDAKLKMTTGNVPEAVASLRSALDVRPDWAQALHILGVALAAQRDFIGARAELARALELDAGLLQAQKTMAQVHAKLGEWDYVVKRGRQYLRERPNDEMARLLVAQGLVRLGTYPAALETLEALPVESRSGKVHYAIGKILHNRGKLDAARIALLAAHQEMPSNADILLELLRMDVREGRFDETKVRIAEALEAFPEDARLRQIEGVVALREHRPDDAEAAFKKAVELDPSDVTGYQRLARFLLQAGRLDETARTYEQALEVRPEDPQLHHFLGVLYELAGDQERAVDRYEEAIRFGPEMGEAKNNLAYIYADSGTKLDRALDLAQDAKSLLPDSASVSDTLGWVLYRRGLVGTAITYLKEAEAATDPRDASLGVVRHHLAQAYEANGERENAVATLDRSLAALEEHMEAARVRGEDPGSQPEWAVEARAMRKRLGTAGG
ncbi:MAG: tetratricopeptide repeat protein [Myxococcales bacterium]|nr:tetratricopeptide repeat protein [Myxococcales bacterium]